MYLLVDILVFCFLGYSVGVFTLLLDFCMDFGHILDFIKLRVGRKVAIKYNMVEWYDKKVDESTLNKEGSDIMNDAYFTLALRQKSFKWLICPICLGTRISIIAAVVTIGITGNFLALLMIPAAFMAIK